MFRYVIAVGNPQSASSCEALALIRRRIEDLGALWHTAMQQPGFCAAYVRQEFSSGTAIVLPESRGIIFGAMFRSSSGSVAESSGAIRSIPKPLVDRILESKARSLVSDYWGHYVVALLYPENARSIVMRSPVSSVPCHYLQVGSVRVFFSHAADCIALNLTALSINWDCITAQLVAGDYITSETGVNEIRALECGACIECMPHGYAEHSYWDPRPLLVNASLDDFAAAADALAEATQYSASAISSPHQHLLVNLSGGLDSSIVLSTLAKAPHRPKLSAVNYYSHGCGDERRFARAMAEFVDCPLIELPRNDRLDLRSRFDRCNWTVQPVLNFSAPDTEERTIAMAHSLGASAIVDGELGDNIFGNNVSPGALVECLRKRWLGPAFFSAAIDYAQLTRQSLWRTLAQVYAENLDLASHPNFTVARELWRRRTAEAARTTNLASAHAEERYADVADRFVHPWLHRSRLLAPGSHALLLGLITVTSAAYHSPFAGSGDPPRVSPLLNQPLVEVALGIPAYLHCKSGQDRAAARCAFAQRLPAAILRRGRGKGGPNLWARDVIHNNIVYLREFLLDGILMQRRLLDRAKLETALSPHIEKSSALVGDIFAKLYIEAWLRKWQPVAVPTLGRP